MTEILRVAGLNKAFGGVTVARDIDFALEAGAMHCLIGPNGAGKSSFFRLLLGEHAPDSGTITFRGEDITRLRPFQRIRRGMSVKFQVPGIFKALSVRQNLEVAFQNHLHGADLAATVERVLDFASLGDEAGTPAGVLSHGQQQWLEIGMAVGVEPQLLLLDEPTAGMSPDETRRTGEMLHALNARGITILAVEHDMAFVEQIAKRVTVLHFGAIFAEGSIAEMIAHEGVQRIYLGAADE
ncbi:ABC transporter ATP-binding protein [Rubrimonas cliftonensis]|uniref:Amino acid/amide ABC transporter ATP-binding protein 1, HAAT family n=1 Tax=Rubrimonas cliftonensis TaxID=89524 RepID=A0A1H3Z338_9RHOB|nr:ABC transporter ATP-binding protein [Rubrimonas cliftonensis]SEA18087.1 amino acid/amide ABC transporter ATP-binding protein 1, HAAT family [Rubrimonas cliftonensis]